MLGRLQPFCSATDSARRIGRVQPASARATNSRDGGAQYKGGAFSWALLSVVCLFVLPANLLFLLGIDYDGSGGSPLTKIHPSTYVALIGAGVAVLHRLRLRRAPLPAVPITTTFMAVTTLCAVYAMISIGATSISNYIDTFLAAGLLTYALDDSDLHQRRMLGYTILVLSLVSVVVSLGEDYAQAHLIPVHLGDFDAKGIIGKGVDQFRGAGLYSGPLLGSMVTAMAIFLLIAMRQGIVVSGFVLGLLIAGLFSFGGRAGLGITLAALLVAGIGFLATNLVRRRLTTRALGATLAAVIIFPTLFGTLLAETDLGARITSHLYVDDSAEVRAFQWNVLGRLDTRDMLFGTTRDKVDLVKSQIGLTGRGDDIESPWLLLFLNFGIIGFIPFTAALLAFFVENARRGGWPAGWLLIGSYIALASTSNSFGEKVPDLTLLVAFTYSMSGFTLSPPRERAALVAAHGAQRFGSRRALRSDTASAGVRGLRPMPNARSTRLPSLTR